MITELGRSANKAKRSRRIPCKILFLVWLCIASSGYQFKALSVLQHSSACIIDMVCPMLHGIGQSITSLINLHEILSLLSPFVVPATCCSKIH